jgi:Na+-translocating ferredoxin:NAD+ oxidoreductase RnfG subunit
MRIGWIMMVLLLASGLLGTASGVVLLNQDQALKQMFPDADKITSEVRMLTAQQADSAKARLGGKWTLYQAGGKADEAREDSIVVFFGLTDGKKTGAALIEIQPGKWGPVKYIIAIDPSGEVANLAVMSYAEQRGRPISERRFLGQFVGKNAACPFTVGKDIDAVSGATISSRATAFAVKKAVVLYETVFPPEGRQEEGQ